ncbi:MAG: cyclase family protein [Candidatus Bathyarchaeia archaeon]
MIDLKRYRIVDLSMELHPGVQKVNRQYVHGRELRRLEIRQFIYAPDMTFMHWVDTETHIGTHVEGPSHYIEGGKAVSAIPIEGYMGEAIILKFADKGPRDGERQPITPEDLTGVREGDIVLMWSPYGRGETPYISPEAAEWLRKRGIKMIGIQGIGLEAPGSMASHEAFLRNDIPIIEGLVNLDQLKRERFFYIGLPLKIAGLDSSWVRAIALEEL